MCINPSFASQMRVAFSKMDWKTRSSLPEGELITASTSEVAACCSNASFSSRVSRATSVSRAGAAPRWDRALGALRPFVFNVGTGRVSSGNLLALMSYQAMERGPSAFLGRALAGLPPALEGFFIAFAPGNEAS